MPVHEHGKIKQIVALQPKRYKIYDKKVYADIMHHSCISFGYLRGIELLFHIHIPFDIFNLVLNFYYIDKIKELLYPLPQIEVKSEIFIEKLSRCSTTLDFTIDGLEETYEFAKQKKTEYLTDIEAFVEQNHVIINYKAIMRMISQNIFRCLPFQTIGSNSYSLYLYNINADIDAINPEHTYKEPSWPHLKLVYDILWRVVNNYSSEIRWKTFLIQLIQLFSSEDHRERHYLMKILHKIYEKCFKLRAYIIQLISNYFYELIYADRVQFANGAVELLQIICAIIPGLNMPINDQFKSFARNVLVPLYKCRILKGFWEVLTQCCVNYVAKDIDGAALILGGLLKFWPQQSAVKEEIFIMVAVNMVNILITHQQDFIYQDNETILVCTVHKICDCMLSQRKPVAERAIAGLKERCVQRLVDEDRKALLSLICRGLFAFNAQTHLNIEVVRAAEEIERIYKSKDSVYWNKMQKWLLKKEKKNKDIADAIHDVEMKNGDVFNVVEARHNQRALKCKKAKPLTNEEKLVRRKHHWKIVEEIANQNKLKYLNSNNGNGKK